MPFNNPLQTNRVGVEATEVGGRRH